MPDTLAAGQDSLAARPDSLAVPADSSGAWTRFWRPRRDWPAPPRFLEPEPRPLPDLRDLEGRPGEDLGDALLAVAAGPLFDQAEVGHRQEVALDGLSTRHTRLLLDGLDAGSRLTGRADLNLLAPGLTDPSRRDPWQRLAGSAGGALDFESKRPTSDSVLTDVRWADGFLGYIETEGEFARPLAGGRALAAARQVFTHERTPGAHFRGNLFSWNWDKPVAKDWLFRVDQRILRDASEILDHNGSTRHLRQSLLRGRLEGRLAERTSLGLDAWRRKDRRDWDRGSFLADREHLDGVALETHQIWTGGGARLRLAAEKQRLSSGDWLDEGTELDGALDAAWTLTGRWGRWTLRPAAGWGDPALVDAPRWHLGGRLGLTRDEGWADLLLVEGATPPTPEQLFLDRDPGRLDEFSSPWLRDSGQPLLADSTLDGTRWSRQELRLGTTLWGGRLPVSLRTWRVALDNDLLETPVSDSSWSWRGFDHVQWGAQLFAACQLLPGWSLRSAQGWFLDNRELVSREFPSYMLDGSLRHDRRFFGDELALRLELGLHHEYGGTDSRGDPLWQAPELWLEGRATRGRFTLWWALRSPFSRPGNARVEDRLLHGHEEWLGVRWGFVD